MSSYTTSDAISLSVMLLILWPVNLYCQQSQTKQPLGEKENPLLIGKRNINDQQINFYSVEREIALGRQLATEFEQRSTLVDDPGINEYLSRLGRNLAIHSDVKFPITIKVIHADDVNAHTLPGGFLYISLGLLKALETESELAAVITHLIAHVAARHGVELASKIKAVEFATKTQPTDQVASQQTVIAEKPDTVRDKSQARGSFYIYLHKLSRDMETEADALGVQYAWAAGYDPVSLIRFFEMIKEQDEGNGRIFRSHPFSFERIAKVKELIARFPSRDKHIINTEEFDRVKARLP